MTTYDTPRGGRLILANQLNSEWAQMSRQRHNIRRFNNLGLPGEPVSHLDQALQRCGLDDSSNAQHFDEYLSQLVVCSQNDDLATRLVLQRVLPGLISASTRRASTIPTGLVGAFDQALSAAWIVIRRFPIDRRPQRVAANLLMDIEYLAFVREPRLKRSYSERNFSQTGLLGIEFERFRMGDISRDPVGQEAAVELLLDDLLRKGLRPQDIQMLRAICLDINSVQLAPLLQLEPRSVRNRRDRAVARAREILLAHEDSDLYC